MSLNGLDSPAIQDAYKTAIVEAGGWFLLKYTSRDSVELLARGTSGVHEARNAIAKYPDASPLYGFIMYRRRRVLIKYIPEGTSRLLQARTAVHFSDVLERYSPYETVLEISTADGLNDTSLAASFPLHTASPSASSSRLHEISEDGEDAGPALRKTVSPGATSGSVFGTQRFKMEKRVDQLMGQDRIAPRRPTPSISLSSDSAQSALSSPVSSPRKTTVSQFLVREDSGLRSVTSLGTQQSFASVTEYTDLDAADPASESATPTQTSPGAEQLPPELPRDAPSLDCVKDRPATMERPSHEPSERSVERPTLTERTNMSETVRKYDDDIDWTKFEPKPKVKLGPRPVAAGERTKRPTVASISTVPHTYRPGQQKKSEPSRLKPQVSSVVVSPVPPASFPVPPPIPALPEYNPRPVSRGSVKSLPSHRSTAMTPDKVRLMRAVELRKKQLRKSNPAPSTYVPPKDEVIPETPMVPKASDAYAPTPKEQQNRQRDVEAMKRVDDEMQTNKADSGIEMNYKAFEKKEEATPESQPNEDPSPAVADPETQARLEDRKADQEEIAEPTVSLDMLDSEPQTTQALPEEAHQHPRSAIRLTNRLKSPSYKWRMGLDLSLRAASRLGNGNNGKTPWTNKIQKLKNAMQLREPRHQIAPRAKIRRRGLVDPLHLEADAELTSDDELFEELQTATVHQAKHITVAKSPVTAAFTRRPSAHSMASFKSGASARTINIARKSSAAPLEVASDGSSERQSPPRDSTPPLPSPSWPSRSSLMTMLSESSDATSLKRNVSTGISKRIQALHEKSSRDGSPSITPRAATPEMGRESLPWRDRKSSVRSPLRSRGSSLQRQSFRMNGSPAQDAQSPTSLHQQLEPVFKVQHDPISNRDSVSVSARIVRPIASVDLEDTGHMEQMQQPQLTINHNRASPGTTRSSPASPALPPLNTNVFPMGSRPEMVSTLTDPNQACGSTEYRTLHSANPKPFSRHKHNLSATMSPVTPSPDDFPAPPLVPSSTAPAVSYFEHEPPAREVTSRTSRFFKRMSNLGTKRRSGIQQSMANATSPLETSSLAPRTNSIATEGSKSDMPPAVVVGNLNIQFPDTLLWKRRLVEIDDSGNLTFSVPQALDIQKGAAKRFHLTDFKLPHAPDQDRQELPHSVMLDFADGSTTLQAACEDSMTHGQVLHTLRSHWKAWSPS
ncbi:proteoglycan 4-like [Teratosphaeria destructans]|uniref:Proteoglycan 4-like n=1 Tax=Teratosphaeria destructans TaxID=418781 RepID=A0A9W7SVH8_9PEZI|nr:proteoglycan 4-like [Teratosphaeria destructans]